MENEDCRLDVELTETGAEMLRKLRSRYPHNTEAEIVRAALQHYLDHPPPYEVPNRNRRGRYCVRHESLYLKGFGNSAGAQWSYFRKDAIPFVLESEAQTVARILAKGESRYRVEKL